MPIEQFGTPVDTEQITLLSRQLLEASVRWSDDVPTTADNLFERKCLWRSH